jgi:Zn-dependent protease with chaperone function
MLPGDDAGGWLRLRMYQRSRAAASPKRVGVEITNPRVVTALKETIQVSGFKPPVVICELHMPYVNATVDNFGHFYSVAITRMLIERSTDAELRAILGHEIAHIKLGHREPRFELTSHRAPETEQAADELSVRWFGKEALLGVLKKLRADAERLHSLRQRATAELDARIKALH